VLRKKTFPLHGSVSGLTVRDTWLPLGVARWLSFAGDGAGCRRALPKKSAPRFAARPDTGLPFDQPIGTGT
jgi:hypothetical protein